LTLLPDAACSHDGPDPPEKDAGSKHLDEADAEALVLASSPNTSEDCAETWPKENVDDQHPSCLLFFELRLRSFVQGAHLFEKINYK
jgi:hypothetical protein